MNLAVRTQKLLTFDISNHHESNVALDVAQAFTQPNAGQRFLDWEADERDLSSDDKQRLTMASSNSRLGLHTNQNYSY